jgi:ribose transport system substrate-binding protein
MATTGAAAIAGPRKEEFGMAMERSTRRGMGGLVVLGVAVLVVGGAAGRPAAGGRGATLDGEAFTPQRQGGIAGALLPEELKLWSYDRETGQYVVVDGDASAPYVPDPRPLPDGSKVGFAEGWAAIPFSYSINKHLYELSSDLGFDVIYCDTAFDAAKAVACAEQIVSQGPTVVLNSNWQAGAAAQVAATYDGAKVPAISVDVIHPNEIFLGADNYTSGFIGGQAAGEKAQADGRCGDVWILGLLGRRPDRVRHARSRADRA